MALVGFSTLALCGCHGDSPKARHVTQPPRQVLATPAGDAGAAAAGSTGAASPAAASPGGSAGVGPVVVPSGQQNVALGNLMLSIDRAVRVPGASTGSVSVHVDVAIRNSGVTSVASDSTAFQVMVPDGDIFPAKADASASVSGSIGSHSVRTGTVAFDLPAAAASNLRLMYRPSAVSQTAIIPLNLG